MCAVPGVCQLFCYSSGDATKLSDNVRVKRHLFSSIRFKTEINMFLVFEHF